MVVFGMTKVVCHKLSIPFFSPNNGDEQFTAILAASWEDFIEDHAEFSCFGAIRPGDADPCIPDGLDDYRIVLHLRDPRDALTSWYYSAAFSHPRKEGGFNPSDAERERWAAEGIDRFVLENRHMVVERYWTLLQNLHGRPNVIFTRYEDLISDFDSWLGSFLAVFDHVPRAQETVGLFRRRTRIDRIRDELVRAHGEAFQPPDREDQFSHKRQVTPGDFRRKLQPSTIEILNQDLAQILDRLEYPA